MIQGKAKVRSKGILGFLALSLGFGISFPMASTQVVDCVAAVVNDQIITLLDVRIHERFGFIAAGKEERGRSRSLLALEELINQKVVLGFARAGVHLDKKEIDADLQELSRKLGSGVMRTAMEEFGLAEEDLREYLAERRLFRTIISQRFSQSSVVTLREMEAYYQETYVPAEKKEGREPAPLVQAIEEIETRIKEKKREAQVVDWIRNLRDQAEIHILRDCLEYSPPKEE
ncbi:MAG TPA: hypothetical protein PLX50_02020 [Candidatus Aminicenantes bacterium]|nr:hypothetical protein [Candidatus Aminicenantes bacterium]